MRLSTSENTPQRACAGPAVRRVVVRDRSPVLDAEIMRRPLNRVALLAAVASLVLQGLALAQVVHGGGVAESAIDHAGHVMVALIWLTLGLLIFLQRRAQQSGQLFLLASAFGATFVAFGSLYNGGIEDATIFAGSLLIFAPLLLSFTRAYRGDRPWRRWDLALYVVPLALTPSSAASLAANTTTVWWRLAIAVVAIYLTASIVQAALDLWRAPLPEGAGQSRALLAGLVAGTIPGTIAFVIPITVTGNLTVATALISPIIASFLAAMAVSVLLYELAQDELVVRRGIVYGFVVLLLVAAYAGLAALMLAGRGEHLLPQTKIALIGVAVALGAGFVPLAALGRTTVDWVLYGRRSGRRELLQELSVRLGGVMAPEELGEALVGGIGRALHLRGAMLYVRQADGLYVLGHCIPRRDLGTETSVPEIVSSWTEAQVNDLAGCPPAPTLLMHRKPLTPGRREGIPANCRTLDAAGAALGVPLVTRGVVQAVLCLRPKVAHDAFDAGDLELLMPVVRQAAVALDNALLFASLQQLIDELRHAYARIAHEQEMERARLARELHDGSAQELANLITVATVTERLLDRDPEAARGALMKLRALAGRAYDGVRRASHALHPPLLDDFGLAAGLERYLEDFREATGIVVDAELQDVADLPPDTRLALFRVAQESMENVRKHSGAGQARIELSAANGEVILTVQDAGTGLVQGTRSGIGMAGMRERLVGVGGSLRVVPRSDGKSGVLVEARVPMSQPVAGSGS